jgi:hypothetical protein
MKNQYKYKVNVSMLQYPDPGIFFKNHRVPHNKKFCHPKKLSIFAPQNSKMYSNLHIHHHHASARGVSCDVFM